MATTPVLLPGKPHGRRSLVGCSPWGRKESDTTERLLSLFTFMHWRRKWQPTPVFLPGESQGQGSLVDCHLWGCTESDTTEMTQQQQQQQQALTGLPIKDQFQGYELLPITVYFPVCEMVRIKLTLPPPPVGGGADSYPHEQTHFLLRRPATDKQVTF